MMEEKIRVPSGRYDEPVYPDTSAFLRGIRPQERSTPYNSSGGGEVVAHGNMFGILQDIFKFFFDEYKRTDVSATMFIGPDAHTRPPEWLENKNTNIDGSTVSEKSIESNPNHWRTKYRKELDIAEAIEEARKQARMESRHDILASIRWVRRKLGYSVPLDELHSKERVEAQYRQEEEASPRGVIVEGPKEGRPAGSTWKALMQSAGSGKPLAKVAKEYRPRIDFYGLDPFLDSSPSLIWFSTKCGIAIGLVQGSLRAFQTINVDLEFLRASGVGVLSILNMSVLAGVIKWGGNTCILSAAFCVGDRLARSVKRRLLPAHDAEQRSPFNYVVGLAFSGSTVGIMPWWVLNDVKLAARLAMSGVFLGGVLGLGVGLVLQRLVALNISRLDATNRQLRRYEALMLRERKWLEQEYQKHKSENVVWW
ncbi:unnamed protein product [Phytomonas sp. EM1]|nr:unnamed protein product [Phytomonas sp. EM1]|eukprot:CCW62604.1 unnamed protein product [Phytomonas sp. isolate EM1]